MPGTDLASIHKAEVTDLVWIDIIELHDGVLG